MKISSTKTAAVAGIIAITAGAVAVLFTTDTDTEDKIRVAFFPNIGHAIPIVGTELGFFAGESKVEARIFDSGPQAVESLFADAIDMAYVGPGPALNGFLKSDSKIIVLSGAASGGSSLIVRPEAEILSAADLEDTIVAAPQIANTQDVSLRTYLAEHGLQTAERGGSVSVLNVANPEIYTLFGKNDIDAAWVPEPWATILVRDLGGERLFYEEDLWEDERFASVLLVARSDYIQDQPDAVQQWLDGHEKTTAWIGENPGEAKKVFAEFMLREYRTEFSDGIVNEAFSNIVITSDPLPGSVSTFAERAYQLGYLGRAGYSLDGMFYDAKISKDPEEKNWQS